MRPSDGAGGSAGPLKVYLSSTFEDLEDYRHQTYLALRRLEVDVRAMEDYVAQDARPVDACLEDVAECDVYVGLIAFRYGHVPDRDNPRRLSVTEMEYRRARALGKPCLVFLARQAKWDAESHDKVTGEGDAGARIEAFRAELESEVLADWFTTPEQAAMAVQGSVSRWLVRQGAGPAVARTVAQPAAPQPRQVRDDLLILHTDEDASEAAALARAVSELCPVSTWGPGLTAASGTDLQALDKAIASSRAVAVVLTDHFFELLDQDRQRTSRVLAMAQSRTGALLAVADAASVGQALDVWPFDDVITGPPGRTAGPAELGSLLGRFLVTDVLKPDEPEVGLPLVVVAMTAPEAERLLRAPPEPLASLAGAVRGFSPEQYGARRESWRPFGGPEAIDAILGKAVDAVNLDVARLRGRAARIQFYPFEPLVSDSLAMWPLYNSIAEQGCLVVVDELSMFDPTLKRAFEQSPLANPKQVALVTLSPYDLQTAMPYAVVRNAVDECLRHAAKRFSPGLDPLCELGLGERRRLDRWLHGNLPRTVDSLRDAPRDEQRIGRLAAELGVRPNPALGRLIAGERSL